MPSTNQVDAQGQRTRNDEARRIVEAHTAALESRRDRDLTSEKLLLHIDGSGDFQWADILDGKRITIPRFISEYRKTENLLRLVVDNAVAHHTTMPLRYFADSPADRRAREQAIVNIVWANHLAAVQDLNTLFAEALYLAMPAGFCPVHRYWREDTTHDWFEPVEYGAEYAEQDDPMGMEPRSPGMIDCWLGNPFAHVFDRAAKRGSYRWSSYERFLPADDVTRAFDHIPEARDLQGSTRAPSAAEFQRIARDWQQEGLGTHGSPVQRERRGTEDGLISIICRETAPGVLADYPNGRLQIVAVPGNADLRRGRRGSGHVVLLADQELPAGDFSFSNFYSHHRASDVHGKPWVEDIDQLQVDLNIALSKKWEYINKMIESPIVAPGGAISEDMLNLDGYALLEVEPSLAAWRPRVMEWPASILPALDGEIESKRRAIYTGGGYQASSRGEAPGSRMAYRAIVALQQADSSIHGPVNVRFRGSGVHFMQGCWRQMKRYGDMPWLIDIVGDEHGYLIDPYINANQLSDVAPRYKLINAFGPSPELHAQEIIELMQLRGADGVPFLRTDEARRQYPNQMIFDDDSDAAAITRRRARTVEQQFITRARLFREQTGMQEVDPQDPGVQQAAQKIFYELEAAFPRLRDDNLQAHIATLSEITQDETADPIARLAATQRQNLYYEWQAMMARQKPMPAAGAGGKEEAQQGGGALEEQPAGDAGAAQPGGMTLDQMAM